jgi:hypothetical protein
LGVRKGTATGSSAESAVFCRQPAIKIKGSGMLASSSNALSAQKKTNFCENFICPFADYGALNRIQGVGLNPSRKE